MALMSPLFLPLRGREGPKVKGGGWRGQVPLAYIAAIAAVSSRGILVKSAAVFDALARCTSIAFDKTGTLTTGVLSCTAVLPVPLPPRLPPQKRKHPFSCTLCI